jgi:hypothetical protein
MVTIERAIRGEQSRRKRLSSGVILRGGAQFEKTGYFLFDSFWPSH